MSDIDISKHHLLNPSTRHEKEWSKLMTMITERRVIPVIGPELLCIPWNGQSMARLYDLWAKPWRNS